MIKKSAQVIFNTGLFLILIGFIASPGLLSQKMILLAQKQVLAAKTQENPSVISHTAQYGDLLKEEIAGKTINLSYVVFPDLQAEYEKIYTVQNISDKEIVVSIINKENNLDSGVFFAGGQSKTKLKPSQATAINLFANPAKETMEKGIVIFSLETN